MGFLRIGSLNVRVKKTTEAFSNFLGVGSASINPIEASEKMHKGWGSADNITQVGNFILITKKHCKFLFYFHAAALKQKVVDKFL